MLLFIIIPTSPGKLRSLTTCQINAKDLLDHKGYAENIPETDKQMLQENFEIRAAWNNQKQKPFGKNWSRTSETQVSDHWLKEIKWTWIGHTLRKTEVQRELSNIHSLDPCFPFADLRAKQHIWITRNGKFQRRCGWSCRPRAMSLSAGYSGKRPHRITSKMLVAVQGCYAERLL